jgi:hypothetical protein
MKYGVVSGLTVLTLIAGSISADVPSWAGTCASNCGPAPIQFVPGQAIRVQLINRAPRNVEFEQVLPMDPFVLRPGQEMEFMLWEGTEPNLSLVFWDAIARPLRVVMSQPNADTLRIEFHTSEAPGDRAIYVQDDGRVMVQ